MNIRIAVPGASGHTGRFVVAELERRGLTSIACDRTTDLDQAFARVDAVINCAGPFAATAEPVMAAAIRAGIPYLDVTAEIEVIAETFARHADAAVPIVPSVGFFGGLGDLLATAALGDWPSADKITIGYALSDWHPTTGTRLTGQVSAGRRGGLRPVYTAGGLEYRDGEQPRTDFPFTTGTQPVVGEFTMADSVTIPTHLDVREIATFMTANAVDDLRAANPSGPVAVDERGRSAQTFHVEVLACRAGTEHRATASGQDIYAVTAPLVVEAALRILAGEGAVAGPASIGARFDPGRLLSSLTPEHLTFAVTAGQRT